MISRAFHSLINIMPLTDLSMIPIQIQVLISFPDILASCKNIIDSNEIIAVLNQFHTSCRVGVLKLNCHRLLFIARILEKFKDDEIYIASLFDIVSNWLIDWAENSWEPQSDNNPIPSQTQVSLLKRTSISGHSAVSVESLTSRISGGFTANNFYLVSTSAFTTIEKENFRIWISIVGTFIDSVGEDDEDLALYLGRLLPRLLIMFDELITSLNESVFVGGMFLPINSGTLFLM